MVVWSIDLVEGGRAEEAEEGGDGGGEGERSVARPRRGEELGLPHGTREGDGIR
jgi:hypothetical protein